MKDPKRIVTRREFLKLWGLGIGVVLVGTRCNPMTSPTTAIPSFSPKPNTPTRPPASETPVPTNTPTTEPTPEPSPTTSPTPDWESMSAEQLLQSAPEKEGFTKDRVTGHDSGRYVTYKNRDTGMVEWVFNTENKEFEHAAESVWSPEGYGAQIKVLVVTSKVLADNFGKHFEINQEESEILAKYTATVTAIELAEQTDKISEVIRDMTQNQKDILVREAVDNYLKRVDNGEKANLRGNKVKLNEFILQLNYDSTVKSGDLVNDDGKHSITYFKSDGDDSHLIVKLRSGQDLTSSLKGKAHDVNNNLVNYNLYWTYGPILWAMSRIEENPWLFRYKCSYDSDFYLWYSIMNFSLGIGNYSDYGTLEAVSIENYPDLSSLKGNWEVGKWLDN